MTPLIPGWKAELDAAALNLPVPQPTNIPFGSGKYYYEVSIVQNGSHTASMIRWPEEMKFGVKEYTVKTGPIEEGADIIGLEMDLTTGNTIVVKTPEYTDDELDLMKGCNDFG